MTMRVKGKKWIWILVAVVLIGFGLKKCSGGKKGGDKTETVRVEAAAVGELIEIVVAPGQIEPRRKVDISAKIAARIVELPFEEGDQVKKGDLLIQLDSRDLESRLRSVQASYEGQSAQLAVEKVNIRTQEESLKATQATFEQAKTVFERQKKLLESKDISQATYDEYASSLEETEARYSAAKYGLEAAKLGLVVMEHNLKASEEQIDQAKEELSYTTIRSPMDGVVTRINAEEGEMVMTGTMNNAGTIIMQVADLSQMLLVARVDEGDIGKLAVGQKTRIRVQAYWGHEFEGTVHTIALTQDVSSSNSKYYETEILIKDYPDYRLFSGLTADVDIEAVRHENVLKVPTQAVVARKAEELPLEIRKDNPNVDMAKTDALVVYRLIDGKAVVTPVTIGRSDMTHIIIESGLSAGDSVVVGPFKVLDNLQHDQTIIDEEAAAKAKDQKEPA
jgi:HlyD family secretion protein